jgi:hypothetical protein
LRLLQNFKNYNFHSHLKNYDNSQKFRGFSENRFEIFPDVEISTKTSKILEKKLLKNSIGLDKNQESNNREVLFDVNEVGEYIDIRFNSYKVPLVTKISNI